MVIDETFTGRRVTLAQLEGGGINIYFKNGENSSDNYFVSADDWPILVAMLEKFMGIYHNGVTHVEGGHADLRV